LLNQSFVVLHGFYHLMHPLQVVGVVCVLQGLANVER
jgi:hypothetical protein